MKTYNFLHDIVRHTNHEFPHSTYISYDKEKYPEQDKDKVLAHFTLPVRDKKVTDEFEVPEEVHRPEDDEWFTDIPSQEHEDIEYTHETELVCIRCDKAEPYKVVLVSTDFKHVVVGDSRDFEVGANKLMYPTQNNSIIMCDCKAVFIQELELINSNEHVYQGIPMGNTIEDTDNRLYYIISCDNSEPGYSVIIEDVDEDTYRVLLDNEVSINLLEAPDIYVPEDSEVYEYRKSAIDFENKKPYTGE